MATATTKPKEFLLRDWLRKKPEARTLVCTCEDGQKRKVVINGKNPRRFFDAEQTVAEIGATLVEALDDKGNTLRQVSLEASPEPEPAPPPPPATPSVPIPSHTIELFAKLLAENTKNAVAASQQQLQDMLARWGDFTGLILKRLDNLEMRQIRQLNASTKALENAGGGASAEGDDDGLGEKLVGLFFKAQAEAAAKQQNGAPTEPPPEPS
jgi:hypothetical protein